MTVGKRIKNRRTELQMSVEELADKLNKNRATIYQRAWEVARVWEVFDDIEKIKERVHG